MLVYLGYAKSRGLLSRGMALRYRGQGYTMFFSRPVIGSRDMIQRNLLLTRMLQGPDTDALLPLPGIGKEFSENGVESCPVVHLPQMAQFVAKYIIYKRQRQGNKFGGKSDFPPDGTTPPAPFERAYVQSGNGLPVVQKTAGPTFQSRQAATQDKPGRGQSPGSKGFFQFFRGSRAATGQLQHRSGKAGTYVSCSGYDTDGESTPQIENGASVSELHTAAVMLSEEVLFTPYPVQTGVYERKYRLERETLRGFYLYGTVSFYNHAQRPISVPSELET